MKRLGGHPSDQPNIITCTCIKCKTVYNLAPKSERLPIIPSSKSLAELFFFKRFILSYHGLDHPALSMVIESNPN